MQLAIVLQVPTVPQADTHAWNPEFDTGVCHWVSLVSIWLQEALSTS